ncbi:MAG TPA: bifunctional diaminohydroxyphosphoribosylaminopyrimidine deaminase/5-amino-6-(5-phosphoribosylamino)uracil reductase RibD [Armatimonadota bacterium]|jgi:diaminohydroxyphosphoribosylaminopyrimidine deaminase/5-amino-6-(5-phosphoribosylamino)uracil reductase
MMNDAAWMCAAYREAVRAVGSTHPNPPVGCVIVRDGVVVGRGHTQPPPGPHAEVTSLEQAGRLARGATAYVSLEPCNHHGRTPPCASALIEAGISRVVAGVRDPNPLASGGFDSLQKAGVGTAVLDPGGRAAALLAPFLHWARTGRPYVLLKAAMTLDGKTASASGESRWITSSVARAYVHRLRARFGAVMVGVETALIDDPLLTVRHEHSSLEARSQPARIVMDSHLRLPVESRLVASAASSPLIAACGETASAERENRLREAGVVVLRVPERDGKPDFAILLAELGMRGVTGIVLEGGGELAFTALRDGCVNEVLYFIAPTLMGGRDAHTPIGGAGFASPAVSARLSDITIRRCGRDFVFRGFVR